MYKSSANFSGWFWLKGKSCKTFDILISTKSVFFKFQFWGVWVEAAARQPLPPLGAPLCMFHHTVQIKKIVCQITPQMKDVH
jgi:hypothetical protein